MRSHTPGSAPLGLLLLIPGSWGCTSVQYQDPAGVPRIFGLGWARRAEVVAKLDDTADFIADLKLGSKR